MVFWEQLCAFGRGVACKKILVLVRGDELMRLAFMKCAVVMGWEGDGCV